MTSTDVAVRSDQSTVEVRDLDVFERLEKWAGAADYAYALAKRLVVTSFVPKQYRDKPEEAAAAILAGGELGFDPMASLRCFDVIEGVAAPRAITLRAVVQSKGHEIWPDEDNNSDRAVVYGRRKGSSTVVKSEWNVERATAMGLIGKDNYRKQRGAMLLARATSECARLTAADAILGIPYSAEELWDGEVIEGQATVTAAPVSARVTGAEILGHAAAAVPAPTAEPELPPEKDRPAQTRVNRMYGLLGRHSMGTKDQALAYINEALGRTDIVTTKQMTKDEVNTVIRHLEQLPDPNPSTAADPAAPATADAGTTTQEGPQ